MAHDRDLETVVNACITAKKLIEKHGTTEMISLIRILLFLVGVEVANFEGTIAATDGRDIE